jgi:GntR family transcriptional regulator, phosphonate transport system regulatory protein
MDKAGISLWRQVGETLASEIEKGVLATNQRLPSSEALAERFAVNRHTILKAVSHLESLGLVRIERGRGAYAVVNPIELRLGARSWFEQNLRESNRTPSRKLLGVEEIEAPDEVAAALKLTPGSRVVFFKLLGEADGFPLNYNYNYFPLKKFPKLKEILATFETGRSTENLSFAALFKSAGIEDFRRKTIRIRSRPPQREEARYLKTPANGHVLVTEVVQVDGKGRPIAFAETCYSAGRVTLLIDL